MDLCKNDKIQNKLFGLAYRNKQSKNVKISSLPPWHYAIGCEINTKWNILAIITVILLQFIFTFFITNQLRISPKYVGFFHHSV